ncbi:hypothetical protein BC834DRAFT_878831, partial [Gloeopeniophorella convolvens]
MRACRGPRRSFAQAPIRRAKVYTAQSCLLSEHLNRISSLIAKRAHARASGAHQRAATTIHTRVATAVEPSV